MVEEARGMQSKVGVEGYRLSPQQARIWSLQRSDERRPYRAQSAVLITGALEVEALKTAIFKIVNRHEILRADFHLLPGMTIPLQAIDPNRAAELNEIDLRDREPQAQRAWFEEFFRNEALREPVAKDDCSATFHLCSLSESASILVTSLPAICADSRSLRNLFQEIS